MGKETQNFGVSSRDIQKARQNAKRTRSNKACARCKASKIKCSDYRPCKNCAYSNNRNGCLQINTTGTTIQDHSSNFGAGAETEISIVPRMTQVRTRGDRVNLTITELEGLTLPIRSPLIHPRNDETGSGLYPTAHQQSTMPGSESIAMCEFASPFPTQTLIASSSVVAITPLALPPLHDVLRRLLAQP